MKKISSHVQEMLLQVLHLKINVDYPNKNL
jgi:hypothetical protein